ncbi:hypothetical protein [Streptomyces hydrogenans]
MAEDTTYEQRLAEQQQRVEEASRDAEASEAQVARLTGRGSW